MADILYFRSGDGYWNDTDHWSFSTSGASAGQKPVAGDTAIIDINSGNCEIGGTDEACETLIIEISGKTISGILTCETVTVSGAGITTETQNLELLETHTINGDSTTQFSDWTLPSAGSCYGGGIFEDVYINSGASDRSIYVYGVNGSIVQGGGDGVDGDIIIGAGGCSYCKIASGALSQSGNIHDLTFTDVAGISAYAHSAGVVTNLIIESCSNPDVTFDFNEMVISESITVNGSDNLTLIGNIDYNGVLSGCDISHTGVFESSNSGNNIFALGDNVGDGGDNTNWVFGGVNLYLVTSGGPWNSATSFSLTSFSGAADGRVPTELDTVYFENSSGACFGSGDCLDLIMSKYWGHPYDVTDLVLHGTASQLSCISGTLEVNSGVGVGFITNPSIPATADINFHAGCNIFRWPLDRLTGDGTGTIRFDEGMSDVFDFYVGDYNILQDSHSVTIGQVTVDTANGITIEVIVGGWCEFRDGANGTHLRVFQVNGKLRVWTTAPSSLTIGISGYGGCTDQLYLVPGQENHLSLTIDGNIADMVVWDAANQVDSITILGTPVINSFKIMACSAPYTFDLAGITVGTNLLISGTSSVNLTVSGNITYSGSESGCTITNVTVLNSDASSGNPIYALGSDVINGHGTPNNLNWIFLPSIIVYETIGTSGRDYATISEWNAATSGLNLVTTNEIRVGLCYNDSPFVENNILVLSGATTDIDHYRKLSVASGQGHSGNIDEGANLDGRLIITESYFQLDGLRIHGSNIYNTGTITVSGGTVTLSGGIFPTYFGRGDNIIIDISGTPETRMIWTRDSNTQITLYTGYPGYVISATPKTNVAYELYHYAATVIYCPGGSSSKNITIKNCIIHDWTCVDKNGWDGDDEPHGNLYGINIIQNGGCKVFNNLIVNILKINADSDYGSMGGIIISNSVADNYVYNNTVLNIECTANFMKASGGIAVYTDSNHTDIKNNISIVRHYVYDQSSIPNVTVEDYSFDFHGGGTSGSGYNCDRGGGYLQTNFMPGDSPNHSISGADPFSVFVFPRHSSNYGNGFYGSAWQAKGINALGESVENYKHIDTQIYQVAPGESGKISFENMYVFEWVGGYQYIGTTSAGNVKLYRESGLSADDGIPTRTLSGTFSYNRNSSSFVLVSGNAELSAAIEMNASGLIKFKEDYIPIDWTTLPIDPSLLGGNYYKHALYNLISASDAYPSGGLITSGIMCIGSIHNNSFIYSISDRVLSTSLNTHLKAGSPCIGTGINLSATFTELNTDIAGVTREAVWDIGAYKYIASALRNLFREIHYYRHITTNGV